MNDSKHDFSLQYKNGYAELIIYPDHREVFIEDIENRMKILKIPPVRRRILEEALEMATGAPVRLISWPGGERLCSRFSCRIIDDGMKAIAELTKPLPGGSLLSIQEMKHILNNKGIVLGIMEDVLQDLSRGKYLNQEISVAKGKKPVHGKSESIRYFFNLDRGKPFRELAYGRIDLKELDFIQNAKKGQKLAEIIPALDPVDGFKLDGTVIKAESLIEEFPVSAGEGVKRIGNDFLACEGGNILLENNILSIEPVVTVKDVNYETGNIDFNGTVIITGSVADGFTVKAGGDIQVGKFVGRAHLKSKRNILLKGGINGDHEGQIECQGEMAALFAEGAIIRCGGSAVFTGALMHCDSVVGGDLILCGGRSEILGGRTIVNGNIRARKIGSLYETKTLVYAGLSNETLLSYLELLKKRDESARLLDEKDRQINLVKRQNKLKDNEKAQVINSLEQDIVKIQENLGEIQGNINSTRNHYSRNIDSEVLAEDFLYPGVSLFFGLKEVLNGNRVIKQTLLSCHEDKIREKGFNSAEMPEWCLNERE